MFWGAVNKLCESKTVGKTSTSLQLVINETLKNIADFIASPVSNPSRRVAPMFVISLRNAFPT